MSFPIRFNPVEVEIEQLDTTKTVLNTKWGQPASKKIRKRKIYLQGQPNLDNKTFKGMGRTRHGNEELYDGWIIFRSADLAKIRVTLQVGDRVVKLAGRDVDFTIKEVRPESPLGGEFLLEYAMIEENRDMVGGIR